MNKNRIRAFTVIEVMIVTLISAIVITIAYKGNEIFQYMYQSFRTKEGQISNLVFLNRILQTDINAADAIYTSEDGFNCLQKKEEIHYTFTNDYILRDYLVQDTFYITNYAVRYTFEGKEALEDDLIDHISFIGSLNGDSLYFDYRKQYAADVLMQGVKRYNP